MMLERTESKRRSVKRFYIAEIIFFFWKIIGIRSLLKSHLSFENIIFSVKKTVSWKLHDRTCVLGRLSPNYAGWLPLSWDAGRRSEFLPIFNSENNASYLIILLLLEIMKLLQIRRIKSRQMVNE